MNEASLTFRIVGIKQETEIAKTYQLEQENKLPLNFIPGQFLTFLVTIRGQQVRRSYSITSLPGEPLRVTIQKVDNGLISRYILNSWKVDDIVQSLPPMGKFTMQPKSDVRRDIFCFAAGSGIVPILPQIRSLLTGETQSTIHLVYSNHNEVRTLFLAEIEALRLDYQKLEVTFLFSDPQTRRKERGRLSNLHTQDLVNSQLRYAREMAVFMICGPFAYMRMLNITLISMHFRKEAIRRENYIPEIMRSGTIIPPNFPDRTLLLEINGKKTKLPVKKGQDILTAALQQGIPLPYSCRGGVCGSCAAHCKKGKVQMSINEVLTDQDLKAGWVLTCTGYPAEDDIVISF
jgi:ring-1,2-phenylacetyl-CoA epoxidase subunit PaaE